MAEDSGRRTSSRATKGQHTKSQDLLDSPAEIKKKNTKRGAKKREVTDEDDAEVIRCVCGATQTTGDDDEDPWIGCDGCGVWQHNVCVGWSTFEEDLSSESYYCEQCAPQNHEETLASIRRGDKIWEARWAEYQKEQHEKDAKKKGRKKGIKRQSDLKIDSSQTANGPAKSPSTPIEPKKEAPAKSGSTKRKAESAGETPSTKVPSKIRKVSEANVTPQEPSPTLQLPTKISDVEKKRQPALNGLKKQFIVTLPHAVDSGLYKLKKDDSVDAKAERLAIYVEEAIQKAHPTTEPYGKQLRAVMHNLKNNQELCNGLVSRSLSSQALAVMSSDDMASKELKQERAKMQARADKQSILTADDGPHIRRTHKGEEVVEGNSFLVSDEIPTVTATRKRSVHETNEEMVARSRENSVGSGNEVEVPEIIHAKSSSFAKPSSVTNKKPPTIQTKQPDRNSSSQADFDLKKVLDKVNAQSPVGIKTQHPTPVRRLSGHGPISDGPGVDPEIDKLLQDDEEPPYSPKFDDDPEVIWHGKVSMDSIASFPASAKHIGGADLSGRLSFEVLLPKELKLAGRIDHEKANEYLCGLRYSQPTDIVVVALSAYGDDGAQGLRDLFEYFHVRKRYGVLSNKGTGNIRDTYLVPAPPSPSPLPDFIVNLEGHKVPQNRTDAMLLVVLVIRQPDLQYQRDGASNFEGPSVASNSQYQVPMSGTGPSMSPITHQSQFQAPSPAQNAPPQQNVEAQRRQVEDEERVNAQRQGELDAARILGNYIHAPTVSFLIPQAFQMRPMEWELIKDILITDPRTQQDLHILSTQIQQRQPLESSTPS